MIKLLFSKLHWIFDEAPAGYNYTATTCDNVSVQHTAGKLSSFQSWPKKTKSAPPVRDCDGLLTPGRFGLRLKLISANTLLTETKVYLIQ